VNPANPFTFGGPADPTLPPQPKPVVSRPEPPAPTPAAAVQPAPIPVNPFTFAPQPAAPPPAPPVQQAPVKPVVPQPPVQPAPLPSSHYPEPTFTFPPSNKEGAESIFSAADESEDEIFGSQPGNRLKIPSLPEPPPYTPPAVVQPVQPPMPVYTAPAPAAPAPVPAPHDYAAAANPFAFPSAPQPVAPPPAAVPQQPAYVPQPVPPPAYVPQPVQNPFGAYQPPPAVQPAPAPIHPQPAAPPQGDPFSDFSPMSAEPAGELAAQPLGASAVQPAALPLDAEPLPLEDPVQKQKEAAARPGRPSRAKAAAAPSGGISKPIFFGVAAYALVMTLVAIYGLFIKSGDKVDPGHPLSTIPDSFGEFDPVKRKQVSQYKFPVDGELPGTLRAGLGSKIEVGQLEIEPVKVEARPLKIVTEGKKQQYNETTKGRALVLQLKVKNTSNDLAIFPMDPAFLRKPKGDDKQVPTRLVVGKQTFLGGAIDWPTATNVTRRYEEQQAGDATPLKPGETRDYVVFTNVDPKLIEAVHAATETLQWRIQIRRGLIEYRGKDVPVTAIIGVEFKPSDVKNLD
jgi:hypothetical protein